MGSKRFKFSSSRDNLDDLRHNNDFYMDYSYSDINNNAVDDMKCSRKRKVKYREEIIDKFLSKHIFECNSKIINILREYDSILQNENLKRLLQHYKEFVDVEEECLDERDFYGNYQYREKKRQKLETNTNNFDSKKEHLNHNFSITDHNINDENFISQSGNSQIYINVHQSSSLKENVGHLEFSNINYNFNFDFEDQTINLNDLDDDATQNFLNLALDTNNFDCTEYTESGFVTSDIINETKSLYAYHIIREMHLEHLVIPNNILKYFDGVPIHLQKLIMLVEKFRRTNARHIVYQRAENVELTTLNFRSFTDLLYGLFQNGGVTWERIMVLFFFCADVSIRALREKLIVVFNRILQWTTSFLTHTVAFVIQQNGGWDCVLSEPNIKRLVLLSSIGFCTGFLASLLYANLKH